MATQPASNNGNSAQFRAFWFQVPQVAKERSGLQADGEPKEGPGRASALSGREQGGAGSGGRIAGNDGARLWAIPEALHQSTGPAVVDPDQLEPSAGCPLSGAIGQCTGVGPGSPARADLSA